MINLLYVAIMQFMSDLIMILRFGSFVASLKNAFLTEVFRTSLYSYSGLGGRIRGDRKHFWELSSTSNALPFTCLSVDVTRMRNKMALEMKSSHAL
jgi:hypothetical protein